MRNKRGEGTCEIQNLHNWIKYNSPSEIKETSAISVL